MRKVNNTQFTLKKNSLTKGLISLLIPNENELTFNMVQSDVEAKNAQSSTRIVGEYYNGKLVLYVKGVSGVKSKLLYHDVKVDPNEAITVITKFELNNTNLDIGLFGFNSEQTSGSWLDTIAGKLSVSAFTSYSTFLITAPAVWSGGLIWEADGSVSFINNGAITDTATQSRGTLESTLSIFDSTNATTVSNKAISSGSTPLVAPKVEYHAIWNRKLSPDEIASFTENPYQILEENVTAPLETYATLFAPGATTTVPNVVGDTATVADGKIIAADLIVGTVTGDIDPVVSQFPSAGSDAEIGSAVNYALTASSPAGEELYLGGVLITELYLGNTQITEMYLGDTKVF